jgi:predicted nucleic acid-binding Zn ribbon protein
MNCKTCSKTLEGKQTKFCSNRCKNNSINHRHKSYQAQQERGLERKIKLINLKGGACEMCGYNDNYAALSFHHKDPSTKLFGIDLRQCSNRSWEVLEAEANKCQLLCANCHMETEYPHLTKVNA